MVALNHFLHTKGANHEKVLVGKEIGYLKTEIAYFLFISKCSLKSPPF